MLVTLFRDDLEKLGIELDDELGCTVTKEDLEIIKTKLFSNNCEIDGWDYIDGEYHNCFELNISFS